MKKTKRIAFLSLVLAVLMTVSVLPLGILAATDEKITATENWYKGDTVLYVNNAKDLWAFAEELQNGTHHFRGQTVKLTADITANENFNAFLENVTAPTNVWPLTTHDKKFAGTFDGQGHTISGLYVTGSGEGVGIFGNVGTGTKATVKNVNIMNSYVKGTNNGVGGIFGEVDNETTTTVYDDSHINATKAIVTGVYAQINVVCDGGGSANLGAGGIIGGARADVEITNTTFTGKVTSAGRGAAAFIGAIRPFEGNHPENGTSGTSFYRTYATIKNSVADAEIAGNATASFAAALVGYTNTITTHTFENVFSACTITGTTASQLGTLVGGSYWSNINYQKRDGVTEDLQEFYFDNVHYLTVSGLNPIGNGVLTTAQKICQADKYSHATKDELIDAVAESLEDSLQQSVSLKNNLSLNVYAMILDPDAEVEIGGVKAEGSSDSLGRYTLDGILPQQMTDTFGLKVTQNVLGETIVFQKVMSVRKYCEAFWEADFATKAEKDLIADMLRYGAVAQSYAEYNVENLATEGMNLAGYGSTFDPADIQTKYDPAKHTGTDGYAFIRASLRMKNSIEMRLMFEAAEIEDLTVTVSVKNGNKQTFSADEFTRWGNYYYVSFDKIYAHQMEAEIHATISKGGTDVATLTYSVADYCKALLAQDATGDAQLAMDQTMATAMYNYGLSANAYNDSNRLVIIDGDESDYVIVYDDANAAARDLALRFARELQAKTGVLLPVVDDTTANGAKEIIIGKANGRSETTTVYNTLTSYNGVRYGSRTAKVGTDIVVVAEVPSYNATYEKSSKMVTEVINKTPEMLQEAVDDLLNEIRTHGGDTWSIGLDNYGQYSAQIDLPAFNTTDTKKVYHANENNFTLSVTAATVDYTGYIAALKADGFVEYTTNTIRNNRFGTYIKTTGGSDMVAYVAYYPDGTGYYNGSTAVFDVKTPSGTITDNVKTQNLRITYGPLDFLLGTEEISASEVYVRATPTIMQPARVTAYAGAPGMFYIIQLLDGSFILIDSGPNDGTFTKYKNTNGTISTDGTVTSDDATAIYNLLVEMSPDKKPVISTWFISHGHGDHTRLACAFMDKYHDQITLKMIAHNFPEEVARNASGNAPEVIERQAEINQRMEQYFPDAKRWIVHTGQKLYLPGCNIEILFTPEDFYGIYDNRQFTYSNNSLTHTYNKGECYFNNGNETSITFRITLGETTFLVTGDSEVQNNTLIGTRYREALQSDILQTPHHGANGPETGFYQFVDPKIVLWSIDEFRMENDARCNGYKSSTKVGEVYISNGTAYPEAYGTSSAYYPNRWIKTSMWKRGDDTGARAIYGISATKHTKIECSVPDGFVPKDPVIETPIIPLW